MIEQSTIEYIAERCPQWLPKYIDSWGDITDKFWKVDNLLSFDITSGHVKYIYKSSEWALYLEEFKVKHNIKEDRKPWKPSNSNIKYEIEYFI